MCVCVCVGMFSASPLSGIVTLYIVGKIVHRFKSEVGHLAKNEQNLSVILADNIFPFANIFLMYTETAAAQDGSPRPFHRLGARRGSRTPATLPLRRLDKVVFGCGHTGTMLRCQRSPENLQRGMECRLM